MIPPAASDVFRVDHDHNFKELVLDYVLEALRFLASEEAADIPDDAVITPLRQEQLKSERSGRFREIDVALRVEWSARTEVVTFLIEEESEPRHFSIHRLGHYLLDLAELNQTDAIVPVVIFLHPGRADTQLVIGSRRHAYASVTYIGCHLATLNASDYLSSTNIVARILLPCMNAGTERRVDVVARAIEGVVTLETDVHKQRKYVNFVSMYAGLKQEERVELQQVVERAAWGQKMTGWLDEAEAKGEANGEAKGEAKGLVKGLAQGKAELLLRLLAHHGLELTAGQKDLVVTCADAATLDVWFSRALSAQSVEDVFTPTAPGRPPTQH